MSETAVSAAAFCRRWGSLRERDMTSEKQIFDEPSEVSAVDGVVEMDGPDAVDVALTTDAAEETSDRLAAESVRARGQQRLSRIPHRPKD